VDRSVPTNNVLTPLPSLEHTQIVVEKTISCTNLTAELCGEIHTVVHYTRSHGSGKNRRTTHHTARQRVSIVHLAVVVAYVKPTHRATRPAPHDGAAPRAPAPM
jgi:hypothetical protein